MAPKKILIFFIVLIGFFCLQASGVFAAGLEVQYPVLQTGATITPQSDLAQYLKYVFDFGIFTGFFAVVLSFIWAGVLYFLSPAIPSALAEAKDRIAGAISGLLILVLLYLIITTINPYLAIFKTNKLDEIPPVEPTTESAGVNFYNSKDCSGIANTNISSLPDLGENLTNKINSVKIASRPIEKLYYISILYDNINYWGKCQYINPNAGCHPLTDPFAASASIYPFDFEPNGNGVSFYRRSFFNQEAGFLKITNSEIKNEGSSKLYIADLRELRFTGNSSRSNNCAVPDGEQDCVQWNKKGECIKKQCPNLAGENISSIKIDGNYLVLLVYYSQSDNESGPWTYCQAFPAKDDINKEGPQQIKWEAVRNRGQNPNFVIIIPIA